MNVLYIINGLGFSRNTGIGGSDKRAVEIIRAIKKTKSKDNFDILTTQTGKKLFREKEKLNTKYYTILKPSWWPNVFETSILGRILSYIFVATKSLKLQKEVENYDIYFASSDFFFDVLPGYYFKIKNNKKLVCMIHHNIKSPFERTGSFLINTGMYISQSLSYFLIKKMADAVFLYDTPEGKKIKNKIKFNTPVYFVKNGIDTNIIDKSMSEEKKYEAVFLGGLRPSKGIIDFSLIWKTVTQKFPKAKLLIIGGGTKKNLNYIKESFETKGMKNNIVFTGPLSGTYLYENLKSGKIFMFPSYEEGWGIALCEAMYCSLPAVTYQLPAYKVFGNELDSYKVGEYKKIAEKIIYYLDNEKDGIQKGIKLKQIASNFGWDKISVEDIKILREIIKK